MARLILKDGTVFHGETFGYEKETYGEVVFQTGMVGYVESLSDPSYYGQILTFTFPLIGNYGVPDTDSVDSSTNVKHNLESAKIHLSGVVVSFACADETYSHHSAVKSLNTWLVENKVVGIANIDTRALTLHLRDHGSMPGVIVPDNSIALETILHNLQTVEIHPRFVSRTQPTIYNEQASKNNKQVFHVLALDFGMKNNQIRHLTEQFQGNNFVLHVMPHNFDFASILLEKNSKFHALYLSNGPGDPTHLPDVIAQLKKVLESKTQRKLPIFGICLGHQILSLALDMDCEKLKFGHRGHNQPCFDTITNKCFITSQNHGYVVNRKGISETKDGLFYKLGFNDLFINSNDRTNEGIYSDAVPVFSTQFHPEHCAGPTDTSFLFNIFKNLIVDSSSAVFSTLFKKSVGGDTLTKYAVPMADQLHISRRKYRVLMLGSGGLRIGQAGEFDYSGSQAIKALKEENIYTVLVNPNIATVQTDRELADQVYLIPVNALCVESVIEREKPDAVLLSFGGQTALNTGLELYDQGVLLKHGIRVLGTPIETIRSTEDRAIFAEKVREVGYSVAPSVVVNSVVDALHHANNTLHYPVMVRTGFSLGGKGSGFAENDQQLTALLKNLNNSSTSVIIDKSLTGWKELEYEVVRDCHDNCVTICNMENFDPLGVHTGESIVVAPSLTLNDHEYMELRKCAIRVVRHLGIIGECNIQFAVNFEKFEFYIIEVNARLSRSSALASKATGYPLAYIGCKLALGKNLCHDLDNVCTSRQNKLSTTACFEPSLDYVVVKLPRWDLDKFGNVSKSIGTSMKSVGEVMAIGCCFEEAIQKAIRMVELGVGFYLSNNQNNENNQNNQNKENILERISKPSDKRLLQLFAALQSKISVEEIYRHTKIDRYFLHRLSNIVSFGESVRNNFCTTNKIDIVKLKKLKVLGFSDVQCAMIFDTNENFIRELRYKNDIIYNVRQIDTVAGEHPSFCNYYYLSYFGDQKQQHTQTTTNNKSVVLLGSGVYRIGSSVEFDCCSMQCVRELRRNGVDTIMINFNPETVSTDFDECHKLYFDEISLETVDFVYRHEEGALNKNLLGVVVSMGGQVPNNLAMKLHLNGVSILGTSPDMIDTAENRFKFSRLIDSLNIQQPVWRELTTTEAAIDFSRKVEFPVLVRPSYVLSGAAMNVATNEDELKSFLADAVQVSKEYPVVISKFAVDAREIDVDAVAFNGQLVCVAISEHVENAGTHSGDATLILPPYKLNEITLNEIERITELIAVGLHVSGPFNLQLIAKDNQLKVIECNLRVSRSFPFVSKVLKYDFIAAATRVLLNGHISNNNIDRQSSFNFNELIENVDYYGVKMAQFSFTQLADADIKLGVEMASTGEVACLGMTPQIAFLKSLFSTNPHLFKILTSCKQSSTKMRAFISIGPYKDKMQLLPGMSMLQNFFELYGTSGSSDFLRENGVNIKTMDLSNLNSLQVDDTLKQLDLSLIINIPKNYFCKTTKSVKSLGYQLRRFAADNEVVLFTERNSSRMFIEAISEFYQSNRQFTSFINDIDSLLPMHSDNSSNKTHRVIKLRNVVDCHVHLRDPGQTHKEDFASGTYSALRGGITTVMAMPNTDPGITDLASLKLVLGVAEKSAHCDYGLFMGATDENYKFIYEPSLFGQINGVKFYLNETFNKLNVSYEGLVKHFEAFPGDSAVPMLIHAEGQTLGAVLHLMLLYRKRVHVCHVSSELEITLIKNTKNILNKNYHNNKSTDDLTILTCEVCPHHLLFTKDSDFGGAENHTEEQKQLLRAVKPSLKNQSDINALFQNMNYIDVFATDHAPHLLTEKLNSNKFVPGFPGVETMLTLLFHLVYEGKLTVDDVIKRVCDNPVRIFNLSLTKHNLVEVEIGPNVNNTLLNENMTSKCGWTPYHNMKVNARVLRVVIRDTLAMVGGRVLIEKGFGQQHSSTSQLAKLPISTTSRKNSPLKKTQRVRTTSKNYNEEIGKKVVNYACLRVLYRQHFVKIDTSVLTRPVLRELFQLASLYYKQRNSTDQTASSTFNLPSLHNKLVGLAFFEQSTRTQLSFDSAVQRLNGKSITFNKHTSSIAKGETTLDTVRMLSGYCDALVVRHDQKSQVEQLANAISSDKTVIINAGDGVGEHPTQALLDCFTIREELGTINKLTVGMCGDLKNGRTVHSLAKLLTVYEEIKIIYIAPDELQIPDDIYNYCADKVQSQSRCSNLEEVIGQLDILYMTRIQKERFADSGEYDRLKNCFVLNSRLMAKAKDKMRVMHPLPRVDEIAEQVDSDPRAAYFRQAEYAMYLRMALLTAILTKN